MAFSSGTIWHNWSTGATTSGGGFDPTNANFATDLTTDADTGNTNSPVVSSASYTFGAGDVGASLFNQSGTDWLPGWYPIVSVAGGKATLNAAIGAAVLYGTSLTARNYHRPAGLNTAAGVATVATPTGGVWSIDYSQQTAAAIAYTDMVIDGATNTIYTSVANPVGKNIIGNIINVVSGTGFTVQRVQIVSTSGTQATCDKSLGTLASTGGTGNLGGAIGSSSTLTALTQALVGGNKVYVKATGTYTLTVTTTVTAATKGDITNGRISVEGFTTTPGALDGRPLITSATNSVALLTLNDNDFYEFVHLRLTHTAATRGNGFNTVTSGSTPVWIKDCIVDGCLVGVNLFTSQTWYLERVEIMNCTSTTNAIAASAATVIQVYLYGCDIHDNAGDGVRITNTCFVIARDTIFDTNTNGINMTGGGGGSTIHAEGCTFVDNVSDGIEGAAATAPNTWELRNNIFYGNAYGINQADDQIPNDANIRINRNNAYGSNTSGSMTGLSAGLGDITLTADPFTNKAGRDFSPNNTAGGGAALRAAGFPGAFPGGTTTSYSDAGAAQHADSGSGAPYHGAMAGGLV